MREFDISVLTSHPHYPQWKISEGYGDWLSKELISGVAVKRLRHYVPRQPHGIRRLLSELSFGLRLCLTTWGKPDQILAVSPALVSTGLAFLRAKITHRGVPRIVWIQDLYSRGLIETGQANRYSAKIITALEAWVLRNAQQVVVIHNQFANDLSKDFDISPSLVTTIKNWSHVGVSAGSNIDETRERLGWNKSDTIVLHTGNMGVKQGLTNVVSAAKIAQESGSKVRFILMGEGSERSHLTELAEGIRNIEIFAPVTEEEYPAVLAAADLLLVNELPGLVSMALPSKISSYLGSGRPIIASINESGVTAQEITASGSGVLVPADSPEQLLHAVELLAADKLLMANLGKQGLKYREIELTADAAIAKFQSLLLRLDGSR
jgi:glycosyltransferase involved in cell wall biosynthesis